MGAAIKVASSTVIRTTCSAAVGTASGISRHSCRYCCGCYYGRSCGAYCGRSCVAYYGCYYIDGACAGGAYTDGACVDGACVDGACIDRACADEACTDGACGMG